MRYKNILQFFFTEIQLDHNFLQVPSLDEIDPDAIPAAVTAFAVQPMQPPINCALDIRVYSEEVMSGPRFGAHIQ